MTYMILKDSSFLPLPLLGSGNILNAITDQYPKIDLLPNIKLMYLVQFGFHFYSFIYQIFMKRQDKKYLEFVLHHGLTIFLIIYSYITNFINLGTIVFLIHDLSDALLSFARGYGYLSSKNSTFSSIVYLVSIFAWIYTRLFMFPIYAIWPCYQQYGLMNEETKYFHLNYYIFLGFRVLFAPVIAFYLGMLITLLLMNVYWTYTLVQAVLNYFLKKKIVVDYNGIRKKR